MKYEPLRRVAWRRVLADGTPARKTRTSLGQTEQKNVLAAVAVLRRRYGTLEALSRALGIPRKTMERILNGERPVPDRWAMVVAGIAGATVDDIIRGRFPAPGACQLCGRA